MLAMTVAAERSEKTTTLNSTEDVRRTGFDVRHLMTDDRY
jgi:hypothetical protein